MIDATRSFAGGPSFRFAFSIPTVGTTVLFGPSGGGKTTLLRMLAGLDAPDRGVIGFGGVHWADTATGLHVPPQQRRIGYVTQEPALFPHLTVRENAGFGVARNERAARVAEILALVGLSDLADRRTDALSGGQRQRVAIARALAPRPRLLLLDEPLSALDASARDALRRDLGRYLHAAAIPTVLVTHERAEALTLGHHIALVADGRILQAGPIADVFSSPDSLAAAHVVGVETVLPARVVDRGDEGLVTLEAFGVRLTALDPGASVSHVFACIRADEVILEPGATASSARNRLAATVTAIQDEGTLVRVDLDCGFPLAVRITRPALRELGLHPGSSVSAILKAPAVHVIPRDDAQP